MRTKTQVYTNVVSWTSTYVHVYTRFHGVSVAASMLHTSWASTQVEITILKCPCHGTHLGHYYGSTRSTDGTKLIVVSLPICVRQVYYYTTVLK